MSSAQKKKSTSETSSSAVCYMGTRDLVHAILLTAGFVVLAMGVSRTHPNEGFEAKKPNVESMCTNDPPLWSKTDVNA